MCQNTSGICRCALRALLSLQGNTRDGHHVKVITFTALAALHPITVSQKLASKS